MIKNIFQLASVFANHNVEKISDEIQAFLPDMNFHEDYNQNNLFYETNDVGENCFHRLIRNDKVEHLEFNVQQLRVLFSNVEFKKYLKRKNKYGMNLLHMLASQNKFETSINFTINLIVSEFGSEGLKAMLLNYDTFNRLPLHYAVRVNTIENFNIFLAHYISFFVKAQIKIIFYIKDKLRNKNIIELGRNEAKFSGMREVIEGIVQELDF